MEWMKLTDICRPKQWKTIASKDLLTHGYPVFGANGLVGYWSEYNHACDTIAIACRGTCGTVSLIPGKSYINGNAMCLDNLSKQVDIKFLYYYLRWYDFRGIITGTTIPQITLEGLQKVFVPCFPIEKQQFIVDALDHAEKITLLRQRQLRTFDILIKTRFVEMFGDPETNPLKWKEYPLSEKLDVLGGYAFRSEGFNEINGIPVLKIGNINSGTFKPVNMVYWEEDNALHRYLMYPGDLVMSLTGTVGKDDYGNVCILGHDYEKYYLNQRNAKLEIKSGLDKHYLSQILRFERIKKRLTGISRGVRQANISNKDILGLRIPIPPLALQQKYSSFVEQIDKSKATIQQALDKAQLLFDSLMQQYFG